MWLNIEIHFHQKVFNLNLTLLQSLFIVHFGKIKTIAKSSFISNKSTIGYLR